MYFLADIKVVVVSDACGASNAYERKCICRDFSQSFFLEFGGPDVSFRVFKFILAVGNPAKIARIV